MNKVWVILKREYLTRVKNKTFIIMTFLGPVLIAVFYGAIFLVAVKDAGDKTPKNVMYKDGSNFFRGKLDTIMNFHFTPALQDEAATLKKVSSGEFDAYMDIQDKDLSRIDSIKWISRKTMSILQQEKVSGWLSDKVYVSRLQNLGMRQGVIDSLRPKTSLNTIEIDETGQMKNSSSGLKSGVGMAMAFIIYLFIFLYGSMVMRSAIEEKTSRIVEVIVSSVKPFQMMMGKILGVALVGLTQFATWIVLSMVLIFGITAAFGTKIFAQAQATSQSMPMQGKVSQQIPMENDLFMAFYNLPHLEIIMVFLIFFLGGFLLYSSMFAAIGAAVNQETDVQQFMFPISLPLIFGFVIAQTAVFQDPNGPMATIFSLIPFTSPIVMVVRSPFGVPPIELMLSIGLLVLTFIIFVWITGRIYRVGILMYGKKPSWRQLGKWIFTKD
jgi:ABC-2 type transport system permease protein